MRRIGTARVALLAAALAPLVVTAGCGEGGGVRVEGDAPAVVAPTTTPEPSAAGHVDPVTLLRRDPAVAADIRAALKPCGGDEYPVDTSYGDLTGGSRPDVVVNVATCGDDVGLAGFVYRAVNGHYMNVFHDDTRRSTSTYPRAPSNSPGRCTATTTPVCCPSGEDVYTYHWTGDRFRQSAPPTRNEYGADDDD